MPLNGNPSCNLEGGKWADASHPIWRPWGGFLPVGGPARLQSGRPVLRIRVPCVRGGRNVDQLFFYGHHRRTRSGSLVDRIGTRPAAKWW